MSNILPAVRGGADIPNEDLKLTNLNSITEEATVVARPDFSGGARAGGPFTRRSERKLESTSPSCLIIITPQLLGRPHRESPGARVAHPIVRTIVVQSLSPALTPFTTCALVPPWILAVAVAPRRVRNLRCK